MVEEETQRRLAEERAVKKAQKKAEKAAKKAERNLHGPVPCSSCDKRFWDESGLAAHRRDTHERPPLPSVHLQPVSRIVVSPVGYENLAFGSGIEGVIRRGMLRQMQLQLWPQAGTRFTVDGIALVGRALEFAIVEVIPDGDVCLTEQTEVVLALDSAYAHLEPVIATPRPVSEDDAPVRRIYSAHPVEVLDRIESLLKQRKTFETLQLRKSYAVHVHGMDIFFQVGNGESRHTPYSELVAVLKLWNGLGETTVGMLRRATQNAAYLCPVLQEALKLT